MGKTRNFIAVDAHFRNSAGAMKHRNAPRRGAKNDTADYLEEALDEMLEELCATCTHESICHNGVGCAMCDCTVFKGQ